MRTLLRNCVSAAAVAATFAIAITNAFAQISPPSVCANLQPGTFPKVWNYGANCEKEPKYQVHQYNKTTFVLRQSLCTTLEGPLNYLLFGENRVLLIDTGTGTAPIRETVDHVIETYLSDNNLKPMPLIVAHSHSHKDHIGGDPQFKDRPDTTIVKYTPEDVAAFFGIKDWPHGISELDLGDRKLQIRAIPGHEPAHIAFYDFNTGLLFSGDTLYPGRLYFPKFAFNDYSASVKRLANLADSHPVCHVLGGHIEATKTPKVTFPFLARYHPNEHPLQLSQFHIFLLDSVVSAMDEDPDLSIQDSFTVYPLP
ncbi:MBL fold metallo-hydrolase [Roseibium sp. RKSG952]|uniref:MBL fold metallo-hydrolase n=1 Tax=Roseibium sp. RKSG952 TaxID=2529384 RepID=UPI0018AD2944|nr:MBL fold metallo-hydrolase [Roseibium sp. RKSG952]